MQHHKSMPLRLGASSDAENLGPLAALVGTWFGNKSANLIAVPEGEKGFQLLERPTIEKMTFTPLGGAVPNRGGPAGVQQIYGLTYSMTVWDGETQEVLHLENGMWLIVRNPQDPTDPGKVARMSCVPHGDVLLAMGDHSVTKGAPTIAANSAMPEAGKPPFGYTDPYLVPSGIPNFSGTDPNGMLTAAIKDQTILGSVNLNVSTDNDGGMLNIPFINQHAKASKMVSSFWIETVQAPTGQVFQQLQYSQQVDIHFLPKFHAPGIIMWPHVSLGTLQKQ